MQTNQGKGHSNYSSKIKLKFLQLSQTWFPGLPLQIQSGVTTVLTLATSTTPSSLVYASASVRRQSHYVDAEAYGDATP